jgi:hypothetical protein
VLGEHRGHLDGNAVHGLELSRPMAEKLLATPPLYRYVWPSELDLMARFTGFRLRERWAGWDRSPFTFASPSRVSVFEKTP